MTEIVYGSDTWNIDFSVMLLKELSVFEYHFTVSCFRNLSFLYNFQTSLNNIIIFLTLFITDINILIVKQLFYHHKEK